MCPTPRFPDKTSGMRIINEEHSIVFFAELHHLIQLGTITVHGEHTVCNHQPQSPVLIHLKFLLQVLHIRMLVSVI